MATLKNVFLVCQDLERSARFFRKLGLETSKESDRYCHFDLGGVELHLHGPLTAEEEKLFQVGPGSEPTQIVLSLRCPDLASALEPFAPEEVLTPPMTPPWGGRLALLRAPEGLRIELYQEAYP